MYITLSGLHQDSTRSPTGPMRECKIQIKTHQTKGDSYMPYTAMAHSLKMSWYGESDPSTPSEYCEASTDKGGCCVSSIRRIHGWITS